MVVDQMGGEDKNGQSLVIDAEKACLEADFVK